MSITVGELKSYLESIPEDYILEFEGQLEFNRLKIRGKNLVVLEFIEPQAAFSRAFKARNPHVKVAFINSPGLAEDEIIREVEVGVD